MQRLFFPLTIFWLLLACHHSSTEDPLQHLRNQLSNYVDTLDAQVGICIIDPQGDTLTVNNLTHYPLMSVYKFHQALAVADFIQQHQIPLDQKIHLTQEDVKPNTYSPLKQRFPTGNINLSIAELLTYTLQLSDNIACDILFDRLVSPKQTYKFLKEATGRNDFQITYTEADMQENILRCYENYTSPYAAAQLLQQFLTGDLIKEPYLSFIRQQLTECQTGANKLPLPLKETATAIGHKTGSGPRNQAGRVIANNDIGFVTLPNQQQYIITVFVKDALLSPEASDSIIANISNLTYQYFQSENKPS